MQARVNYRLITFKMRHSQPFTPSLSIGRGSQVWCDHLVCVIHPVTGLSHYLVRSDKQTLLD